MVAVEACYITLVSPILWCRKNFAEDCVYQHARHYQHDFLSVLIGLSNEVYVHELSDVMV